MMAAMTDPRWTESEGPFRADQIRDGDPYELSNGHAIHCMSAGERHGNAHIAGSLVIATAAPSPQATGIDVGVAWNDGKNLRAPDLSVGNPLNKPGWSSAAPPLAIEYAGVGQDEDKLTDKIAELLALGTRLIWVVRLTGPLRVEIHEPGAPMRLVDADATLTAPGILERDVPVRALIEPDVAVEEALHNILAKKGYRNLDAVREEGRQEGHKEGHKEGHQEGSQAKNAANLEQAREFVRAQLHSRRWVLSPTLAARIADCTDLPTLMLWAVQIATFTDAEAALR